MLRIGNLPRFGELGRVAAEPFVRLARLIEGANDELADVVDRLGCQGALLRLKQALDVPLRDPVDGAISQGRVDDVASAWWFRSVVTGRPVRCTGRTIGIYSVRVRLRGRLSDAGYDGPAV